MWQLVYAGWALYRKAGVDRCAMRIDSDGTDVGLVLCSESPKCEDDTGQQYNGSQRDQCPPCTQAVTRHQPVGGQDAPFY
jgi:hypothetical protein